MKKIFYVISAVCAIVAAVSCEKNEPSFKPVPNEEGLIEISFTADRETIGTKAALESDLKTSWEMTDTIGVYDGSEIRKFAISSISGDHATFTGQVAEGTKAVYAVYPYTAFSRVSTTLDSLFFNIPSNQKVSGKQIVDPAALVSYTYSTNIAGNLHFQNLVSLVKVTVPENVLSVTIKANPASTSSAIVSASGVKVKGNEISGFSCTGNSSVSLNTADGSALAAGDYYIAVAPSKAEAGLYLKAKHSEGIYTLYSEAEANFERNGGLDLGAIATNAKTVNVKTTVATPAEFRTFLDSAALFTSSDVLKIAADLDLGGADWKTSTARFLGSIDGQNHRIFNYVIKSGEGTQNAGDAAVIGRVGAGKEAEPYYVKNLVFGSKDYDFASGKGTYDGVSKVTYESLNNGSDGYYYPGAVAYCYAYGTIENLVNFTPVEITAKCETPHRAGALLGTVKANVTIKNCTNYGDLSDATQTCTKNPTVGGIVGAFDGADCVADGCKNYGNITVTSPKILDFAGLVAYDNYVATFKNCENHGNVTGKYELSGSTQLGGITSRATKGGTVFVNCLNTGKITGEFTGAQDAFVAGIVGRAYGCDMNNVDNSGEVSLTVTNTGKNAFVGGITANSVNQNNVLSKMVDCDNSGKVVVSGSGNRATNAGVNGYNANNAPGLEMTNCHNTGELINAYSGTATNGGVAGVLCFSSGLTTMTNCSNKGNITFSGNVSNNTYVGGISSIWGSVATHVMDGCVNEGAIVIDNSNMTDESKILAVGGIAGTTYGSLKNCVNKGTITTGTAAKSARLCVGGVTGGNYYVVPAVVNCTNEGAITVGTVSTKASNNIGGIVGPLSAKVLTGCANKGNITVTGSAANLVFVGGIAGGALAKETGIAGDLPATVGLDGCSVDCAIVTDAANAGHAGSVLGNVTVATEIALGATTPIAVKGSVNGTALTAGVLQTIGSAVTATNVSVNAVLAE